MRLLGMLVSMVLAAGPAQAAPDVLVLTGGQIYTASDAQPQAEAVVAVDGRIVYVGSTGGARKFASAGARVVDLAGQTVLPGLTDAHAHLAGIGYRELEFNLEGTAGIAELQERLKARARNVAPGRWITGRGWIETHWTPATFPTKRELDAVVSDRPVLLGRADGHGAVANTLALSLAHLDRTTPNPTGGEILRDPPTGEPTGMLIDNAIDLVRRLVPPRTPQEIAEGLRVGAERSVRLGWTQLQVAGNDYAEVSAIRQLYGEGRLKLRIYDAIYGPSADVDRLLGEGASKDEYGGRFTLRGIKLYIDGALGSRGAALLAPYADAPSSGLLLNTEEKLLPILTQALRQGIQVETHAIGDRGNRIMLDLYEKAFAAVPTAERKVAEPRWRIEHAQILAPVDIPRFAQLGVIPSMQPSHAIGDLYFAPARLGRERLAGAYAWRSLIAAGSIIPGGSDAPVERGEPMIEFYAAVTRRSLDGFANEDWHREQHVTRAEALKMFTLWPAYAAFQEMDRGTIEVGKQADFTVLSADVMTIPEAEILKTRCVMTVIGGEVVFDAAGVSRASRALAPDSPPRF